MGTTSPRRDGTVQRYRYSPHRRKHDLNKSKGVKLPSFKQRKTPGKMPAVSFREPDTKAAKARSGVKDVGVERNGLTRYDNNVTFENLTKVEAMQTTVKEVRDSGNGVVKGSLMPDVPCMVTSNNEGAIAHAMKKRCDYPVNVSDPAAFIEGHKIIMSKCQVMPLIQVDSVLLEEYFATLKPGKVQKLMSAMVQDEWTLDGANAKRHVFAKLETLLKDHGSQPRIVYQGTDMHNLLTGAVVYALAKNIRKQFSRENPLNTGNVIIWAPGVSGAELGQIIDEAVGVPIESDFKNNDGSQGLWRKHEAMFYKKNGAPDWFVRHFARETGVDVWTRVGIKAHVEGQRWSGEGTTTTGNTYVGAAQIQAGLARAKVTKSVNIHGGDDYAGVIQEKKSHDFATILEESVASTGMKAEVVRRHSKNEIVFYRKRFPYTPGKGRLPVPQFGRVLSKINIRANQNTEVDDRSYMAGKYLSAAVDHKHVPIVRDILLRTSLAMSDKPYLDDKETRHIEGLNTGTSVQDKLETTPVHSLDTMGEYCTEIYGHSFDDVVASYEAMAASAMDYLHGWVEVGRNGKFQNKADNWRYKHRWLQTEVASALVRVDVLT
jgi:hypothetical protein